MNSKSRTLSAKILFAATALSSALVLTGLGEAQAYSVLHNFTGGQDGATPIAGVTLDPAGNLYGTTSAGGTQGVGTVYQLVHSGPAWNFNPLYAFRGLSYQSTDGSFPYSGVVIGPDGALYGTTHSGGDGQGCRQLHGCGTVYKVERTSASTFAPWQETVLFQFGDRDGSNPDYGSVAFDRTGNLYGTTRNGGTHERGIVYELMPVSGSWTEKVIYSFADAPDGTAPLSGPVFDQGGSLYGITSAGGTDGWGTIYRLTPTGLVWEEKVLQSFQNDSGLAPTAEVVLDQVGNLYGATQAGGAGGGGTVFELMHMLDGNWALSTLHDFLGLNLLGSSRSLVMDGFGNLYGTTSDGGANRQGSVFKLTRANGSWTYIALYDFEGGWDGARPYGSLSVDANGNIYGTASAGGADGQGVVFAIAP